MLWWNVTPSWAGPARARGSCQTACPAFLLFPPLSAAPALSPAPLRGRWLTRWLTERRHHARMAPVAARSVRGALPAAVPTQPAELTVRRRRAPGAGVGGGRTPKRAGSRSAWPTRRSWRTRPPKATTRSSSGGRTTTLSSRLRFTPPRPSLTFSRVGTAAPPSARARAPTSESVLTQYSTCVAASLRSRGAGACQAAAVRTCQADVPGRAGGQ